MQDRPQHEAAMEEAIQHRMKSRGLTGSIIKLRYLNGILLDELSSTPRTALYVGVGHGLDTLLAIADGKIERAVGVDPYYAEDGNDDCDFNMLREQIAMLKIEDRLKICKQTIENYLASTDDRFDLIIINDVLHHMFVSETPLIETNAFHDCINLFRALRKVSTSETNLIVSDVSRDGFRQYLIKGGYVRSEINYKTKQNWKQWNEAISQAGWRLNSRRVYIPHILRKLRQFIPMPIGLATLCDKYILVYNLE